MNTKRKSSKEAVKKIGSGEVKLFFLDTLNTIYCAKSHLIERLPEIIDNIRFADLEDAIFETIRLIEQQIDSLGKIYNLLGREPSFERLNAFVGILDNSFIELQKKSEQPYLRDLFLMSYLYIVESAESASFKILKVISGELNDSEIKKRLSNDIKTAETANILLLKVTNRFIKSEQS